MRSQPAPATDMQLEDIISSSGRFAYLANNLFLFFDNV